MTLKPRILQSLMNLLIILVKYMKKKFRSIFPSMVLFWFGCQSRNSNLEMKLLQVQRPFTWFTNDTFKKSNYFPGNDTYLVPNDYLTGSFPAIVRTLQKTLNFTLSVFKRYLVVLSWSEFMQWIKTSFEGAFLIWCTRCNF